MQSGYMTNHTGPIAVAGNSTSRPADGDDSGTIFERVNAATVRSMVPVIALISVLMAAGLLGNLSVCYYYGFRIARTPSSLFILVLAGFDLVMSAVGMPMEIVDLYYFYTFDNTIACKTLKFLDAFVAIGSLLTLLVIGFDRYRRICRPFSYQLGKKAVKLLSLLCAATSLLLSWPTFLYYNIEQITIANSGDVTGKDCTFVKEKDKQIYLKVMNFVYLSLFSLVVISLVSMYLMIVRAIFKQKKTRRKVLLSTSLTSLGSKINVHGNDVTTDSTRNSLSHFQHTLSHRHHGPHNFIIDKKTVKFTILMFTITAVILLGFVPYIVLSLWRVTYRLNPSEVLTGGDLVGFQIGIRSVLLNAAINPLIYGFFYSKFRLFCFNTVCCCCPRDDSRSDAVFNSTAPHGAETYNVAYKANDRS